MTAADGSAGPRVRRHVQRAVDQAGHVVLDFGVMFDVTTGLRTARDRALQAVQSRCPRAPHLAPTGPMQYPRAYERQLVHARLAFLAQRDPQCAITAEAAISNLELTAALDASAVHHLSDLLTACAVTGRAVAVISDLAEEAVTATLAAHPYTSHINAGAARQGLDLTLVDAGRATEHAAALLDTSPANCLLISGYSDRLFDARHTNVIRMGCEAHRSRRKHLAHGNTPVAPNLTVLTRAMLAT